VWPFLVAQVRKTPIWQFSILPAVPLYWRFTPQERLPFLIKPVSSTTSAASGSPSFSSM
jgi:hypothetical protein